MDHRGLPVPVLGLRAMVWRLRRRIREQVNEMPSFDTAAPIDRVVKSAVVSETLAMVCPTVEEARLLTALSSLANRDARATGEDPRAELVRLRCGTSA